jgi:hypothetical protein
MMLLLILRSIFNTFVLALCRNDRIIIFLIIIKKSNKLYNKSSLKKKSRKREKKRQRELKVNGGTADVAVAAYNYNNKNNKNDDDDAVWPS